MELFLLLFFFTVTVVGGNNNEYQSLNAHVPGARLGFSARSHLLCVVVLCGQVPPGPLSAQREIEDLRGQVACLVSQS